MLSPRRGYFLITRGSKQSDLTENVKFGISTSAGRLETGGDLQDVVAHTFDCTSKDRV